MSAAARTRKAALGIEILMQSEHWRGQPDAKQIVRRAVRAADAVAKHRGGARVVCVVLSDDAAMRALNRDWRGKDAPTNVLSFPAAASPNATGSALGDIVIAFETVEREAQAEGKPFLHHLAHLAVHGFLHLCGYDHQQSGEAAAMEELERAVLARLDIPDPYRSPPRPRAIKARG
jgi:probable rRNA maturation factor